LLAINLDAQERLDLQKRGTQQAVAYDYYVRARGHMQDYHKQENISAAIAAYKRAIDLDPNFANAYAGLGEAYWRDFQQSHEAPSVSKAADACRKAVALSEQSAEGHFCLGRVYGLTGQPEKAIEQFELAVVLDPNSDDGYRGLADAYSNIGKLQNAEATYQRAIGVRPQYWATYSWLGNFYFRQARYDDAVKMFKKVLELSPDNFRGYSNLGAIHVQQGKYAEAIQELEKSIAIRPTVGAYANLGTAYFGLRRFAEAAATYEQGIKLDDKNYTTWGNLGDARYWAPGLRPRSNEAYAKAIDFANKELQVNPRDGVALSLLATYYAMSGDKARAEVALTRAAAVIPDSADLSYRAAVVHNHFGETSLTLQSISKALSAGYSAKLIRDAPDFDALHGNVRFMQLVQSKIVTGER
jgi:serine/threonine-protein kinase